MIISKTYNTLIIILGLTLLVLGYLGVSLDSRVINSCSVILILTLGILHGSNDLELHKLSSFLKKKSNTQRLSGYIVIMVLVAILYFTSPTIAVSLFILVSAYHFGEEVVHSKVEKLQVVHRIWAISYGLCIIIGLLYFNISEVNEVLSNLGIGVLPKEFCLPVIILTGIIQFQLSLRDTALTEQSRFVFIKEQLELVLLFAVFWSCPLLLGFTIYFIFWHSLPSIHSQIKKSQNTVSMSTVFNYVKSSGSIYVLSVLGAVMIYVFVPESAMVATFIVIAMCVSIPHIITIATLSLHQENTVI